MRTLAAMAALDWTVLSIYFLALMVTGIVFALRETRNTEDYFLAGRKMPAWAVAVSIVATSLSAASFVGVPELGYTGDLTYLSTNIGMILAALVVGLVFIPAFYRARVQTIYQLLAARYGERASQAASWMFMIGRVMASGARIYIGAIPAAIVVFGPERGAEPGSLMLAIGVLAFVGVVYTLVGGVSSVIWTDVIQMAVLLAAGLAAIWVIVDRIPASAPQVLEALSTGAPGGASKLRVFDLSTDVRADFGLLAAFVGFTLIGIGSYGTDQDLAQRMLTCRSSARGSWSVIWGILLGIPSVALLMAVGLLLWVFYQRPNLMGPNAPPPPDDDARKIFVTFILDQMPAGVSGLMMAGLFAAGLSSLNSAINAMSSTFVNDCYRRLAPARSERHYVLVGRTAVVGWGVVLAAFACFSVYWQQAHANAGGGLLTFALSVMTFAYAGLVGVFLTLLLTRRGSAWSAIAALVVGFVAVLVMQPGVWARLTGISDFASAVEADLLDASTYQGVVAGLVPAFPWRMTAATALAMLVCLLGRPAQASRS